MGDFMPAPASSCRRTGLVFAAAVLSGLLLVAAPRRTLPDRAGWSVADLVRHLGRELDLRVVSTGEGFPMTHNAFLVRPDKPVGELGALTKHTARLKAWKGVVYCERVDEERAEDLVGHWAGACLWADPFVFFGDPQLLGQIREVLRPAGAPGRRTSRIW
jgi:hypothetical protein